MSRKEWIFIVNPVSGRGKAGKINEFAKKRLLNSGIDFEIISTTHRLHAKELARHYRDKVDVMVAVGGDGTVNEVGAQLLHANRTLMGIIPCGSGNGLARTLGIPMKMGAALRHLTNCTIKTIDAGRMNDEVFFCACGFGFDALIAHRFGRKGKRGLASYIAVVRQELFSYKPMPYSYQSGEFTDTCSAFMLSVANGTQFGNNFFINPLAKIDDGKLNLTIIKTFRHTRIPGVLTAMRLGRTHKLYEFMEVTGENFSIDFHGNLAHLDGEPVKLSGPVHIECVPACLKVLI